MIKDLNPSCEYKHCKSFFQINFSTMKWMKSIALPVPISSYSISDDVRFVNQKGDIKQKTLINVENYLFYKTKKDKLKWIDFENAIIEQFHHQKYGHAIRLIKCFDVVEIFCDAQSWFKYIKRFTIQSDFNSNYILRKRIGRGQFSEVFKAKNKQDGNEYAIKIYQKSNLFDEVDRAAIQKQISVLRRLQSDFTIKFYEVFESTDQVFVVQELLMGGNLMDYIIRENFFSEDQAAKLIFRLVKAVNYIHSKNIIHRDIKPENLIFRFQDNVETLCIKKFQLADFYNPDVNYHYICCGTPGFIAPEILLNQNYDQKVDVFSIGVTLYILMTGQMPFEGDFEKRLEQNVEGLVDFSMINLSILGMNFIKTTLQPNPEERLSSHQCLNHQWFVQEQLAKINQMQLKKPIQLQNQFIVRRMKQAKTLTFSPSSPRSQVSIQSPRNHNLQQEQKKQPPILVGSQTEKLIGPHSSSKSIHFEQIQTQPTDDDDQNQDFSNLKSARKKTQSFVIKSTSTLKNFHVLKSKFK
ncbi:unnamed protein product [Paramecium pentaurelia]|uniref:Protein kinase domain-containing protein n=1 Tax=Paramecium pentaurelia TaxID=43138 RepID=A0A8S1Y5B0_9CILI|nr:unnamed protein product [Paramecium pentaurelia]